MRVAATAGFMTKTPCPRDDACCQRNSRNIVGHSPYQVLDAHHAGCKGAGLVSAATVSHMAARSARSCVLERASCACLTNDTTYAR